MDFLRDRSAWQDFTYQKIHGLQNAREMVASIISKSDKQVMNISGNCWDVTMFFGTFFDSPGVTTVLLETNEEVTNQEISALSGPFPQHDTGPCGCNDLLLPAATFPLTSLTSKVAGLDQT